MTALLALSDVLVIGALERSCSRGLTGEQRRLAGRHSLRYRAYEFVHIPPNRHTPALEGAWALTAELTIRHSLPVDAGEWSSVLDNYCRGLLASGQPHTLDHLEAALLLLEAGYARR